jgi:endonuclease YncB( thermonuclease family)
VRSAFLVAAALLLSVSSASAQVVQRVIDGDTVAIQGIGTVRLIGVDAPEADKQSAAFLRQMIVNKVVRLEFDHDRTDRYDRVLAYIYLPDGTFVNAEIVKQGYAKAYTTFPFRFMEPFRAYEREARAAKRGMWANGLAVAAAAPAEVDATTTVYVTRTGKMYHRAGCRSLARSQIPMSLGEAAARYGACGICKPPTFHSKPSADVTSPLRPSPAASPGRCQAITKRGTQCSRNAQPGRNYCWQH